MSPNFLISYRDGSGCRGEMVQADSEQAARELWYQCHDSGFITGVRRVG